MKHSEPRILSGSTDFGPWQRFAGIICGCGWGSDGLLVANPAQLQYLWALHVRDAEKAE